MASKKTKQSSGRLRRTMQLCLAGLALNLAGMLPMYYFNLPLYLDATGTILTAAIGGSLPGVLVAFATGFISGAIGMQTFYYGVLNMLLALIAAAFTKRGLFHETAEPIITLPVFVSVTGILRAMMTWLLEGFTIGGRNEYIVRYVNENSKASPFFSQIITDTLIDLFDKAIIVILTVVIIKLLPETLIRQFDADSGRLMRNTYLSEEFMDRIKSRTLPLRYKFMAILIGMFLLITSAAIVVSYFLYRNATIERHIELATTVTQLGTHIIDPDKVEGYLVNGAAEPGYNDTEQKLYQLMNSSPDIKYLYVYQMHEDGYHAVFDLDTPELKGAEPGEVVEYDEVFVPSIPDLLAGNEVEPVIATDNYGWLLSVYTPLRDSSGKCVCYVCADISMHILIQYAINFIAKLLALFVAVFILVFIITIYLLDRRVVRPVNAIAYCAGAFANNSDAALEKSVKRINSLDINTGDEIENLYQTLVKTTNDSMQFADDIHAHTLQISQMQNALIAILGDLVESRDKFTQNHVRRITAYVQIILAQMKKRGYYSEQLTDEFIENVLHAVPLHDVGKIHISDQILNKPGPLTQEEMEEVQKHTTIGGEIMKDVIKMVPESGYLKEARDVAEYHHEKWNGKGYPHRLKGEQIPLAARIMAVADVFDALISQRSYKAPLPFDEAMKIIEKDLGTHFDPLVAQAFLDSADKIREAIETCNAASSADNAESQSSR